MQFRLRSLMLAVAAVGIGCAALLTASSIWLTAIATFTMIAFMVALTIAFVANGEPRAKAIGFSVVGLCYVLASGLLLNNESAPMGQLATTELLRFLHLGVAKKTALTPVYAGSAGSGTYSLTMDFTSPAISTPNGVVYPQPMPWNSTPPGTITSYSPDVGLFVRIGHLLWALAFAWAGRVFGGYLFRRQQRGPGSLRRGPLPPMEKPAAPSQEM